MATLKPFKSTTLEGAFLEAAFLLESGEIKLNNSNQTESDTQPWHKVSFSNLKVDTAGQKCVITATLPLDVKSNSFGGYLLVEEVIDNYFLYPA